MNGFRRVWPLIVVGALLATLAACGKRAGLEPPDDATARYTYPQTYPNPASVLPPDSETPVKSTQRPPSPHAGDLSPFPTSRTKTIYRSGPSQ